MRGYQKRVIYLKNTGCRDFEEAYFVVRQDADGGEASSLRMIEEANRIIDENFEKKHNFLFRNARYILAFISGAALSLFITFLLEIIFNIF